MLCGILSLLAFGRQRGVRNGRQGGGIHLLILAALFLIVAASLAAQVEFDPKDQVSVDAHPQPRHRRAPQALTWWEFTLCNDSARTVHVAAARLNHITAGRLNLVSLLATPKTLDLERQTSFWGTFFRVGSGAGIAASVARAGGGWIGTAIPIATGVLTGVEMLRKSGEMIPDFYGAPGPLLGDVTLAPRGQAGDCASGFRLAQRMEPENSFSLVWGMSTPKAPSRDREGAVGVPDESIWSSGQALADARGSEPTVFYGGEGVAWR